MQNFVVARTSLLDASAATELAATSPPGTTAAGGVRARSISRLFRLSSVSTALAFRMLRARRAAVAASTSSEAGTYGIGKVINYRGPKIPLCIQIACGCCGCLIQPNGRGARPSCRHKLFELRSDVHPTHDSLQAARRFAHDDTRIIDA